MKEMKMKYVTQKKNTHEYDQEKSKAIKSKVNLNKKQRKTNERKLKWGGAAFRMKVRCSPERVGGRREQQN